MLTRVLFLIVLVVGTRVTAAQVPVRDTIVPRSALAGTIRDTTGRALPLVTVSVAGREHATLSDSAGRFLLGGLAAGASTFTVMRIGYRPLTFDVTLPQDSTVVIDILMRSAQTLATVEVIAARQSARLARDGFYERQRIGWGKYLSPEQVENLSHRVMTPAQLLRDVSGLRVDCSPQSRRLTGGGCRVMRSLQRDRIVDGEPERGCLALFIDGVHTLGELDENMSVGGVYAVEVYNRPSIVPGQYAHARGCGAILVWTRSRAP